jgi:hypothetical protein
MIIRFRVRRLLASRILRFVVLLSAFLVVFEVLAIRHKLRQAASQPPPKFAARKIFVASIHWTDERILRDYWIQAVANLAKDIGSEDVFVSVFESGSLDNTKGALQELDTLLEVIGAPHKIVLDETTHQDEVSRTPAERGWIQMPQTKSYRENWTEWFTLEKGSWQPRRIPYLATVRNRVMEPLLEQQKKGVVYDKILWLNDVVFRVCSSSFLEHVSNEKLTVHQTEDVRKLLATREGDYAAACALDFKHAPAFYDTFALRDIEGHAPLTDTWPFFRSRKSLGPLRLGQPVPVASCWNGMVAFDAAPFYDTSDTRLAFRGISDELAREHLEGSECCLIHADNPMSSTKGVWLNPNVHVAYNGTSYESVVGHKWPSMTAILTGLWKNRFKRWTNAVAAEERAAYQKVRQQKAWQEVYADKASMCLIDEMQILLWNGWGHA